MICVMELHFSFLIDNSWPKSSVSYINLKNLQNVPKLNYLMLH